MELARICAGFTAGQSDRLRQAMTHKRSSEQMEKLRDEVYRGMAGNDIGGTAADEIWEKLQGFASFGFPESHSVSFAYIVYATSWLKYHWPTEFFAGLLNAPQHHGVVVLPPDINQSWYDCTVVPHPVPEGKVNEYLGAQWRRGRGPVDDPIRIPVALRVGLRYVRNLGDKEITRIEAARQIGGPFDSAEDLAQHTGLDVGALEALSASGALTPLGLGRREGIWAAGTLAQLGPGKLALSEGAEVPDLVEMTAPEVMQAELWSTSISPAHPVRFLRERLDQIGCTLIADVLALQTHGKRMRVGGLITHRQRPSTARGVRFLNLEDETGLLNVVVLPQVWEAHYEVARKAIGVVIDGVLEYQDGVTNFLAHRFENWPVEGIRSRDFR